MGQSLTRVSFNDLPGWAADDPSPIIDGLRDCARHVAEVKPYRTGSLNLCTEDLASVFAAVSPNRTWGPSEARHFFESQFQPCRIDPDNGKPGFVTAYYEPELQVSANPSVQFCYPIYNRPHDLVAIDDTNRPQDMDRSFVFARKTADAIVEYPDRRAIDQGFLEGRGLEIAWASSKVDVFFMHIQGAARLCFEDGTVQRVTYAAKSGHPFTAIGKILIDRGEQHPDRVTMQSLRGWLDENPDQVDDLLWQNRSYIFFRKAPVDGHHRGPVAAAKVPLLAGRSLAVDRLIHTFATPFYIKADDLTHLTGQPFRRLMLAQDTGSAIVGPARGDIFTGSGDDAGDLAGSVKHEAVFYALIPNAAAKRLLQ